jgi:hypothetical protein
MVDISFKNLIKNLNYYIIKILTYLMRSRDGERIRKLIAPNTSFKMGHA